MPKNTMLTSEEKGAISAFREAGWSLKKISEQLQRSRCCIRNFLADPVGYGTKKASGRPPKLSATALRRLQREASKGESSARQMRDMLDLNISVRRVQQVLHSSGRFVYIKRKGAPKLEDSHKTARYRWAKEKVKWGPQWQKVVFSDEKKFNLDGPDCADFYWHDLRKEKQWRVTRQSGGGSVMIWAAFSFFGKSKIAVLNGNQNAEAYTYTLGDHLLPFAHGIYGTDFVFQQDLASIHTARLTKDWITEAGVRVLDWPSKSPDLNPIENLWGVLARAVYANGKQYENKKQLIEAILREWDNIELNLLQRLISSMQDRCIAVLQSKGGRTKY